MIYLDYAATTPCDEEVVEAMLPFFTENFANAASSDHLLGAAAKKSVDIAREAVAELVGARPEDVLFTSGATESNNLALNNELPLITGAIEHPSVLDAAHESEKRRNVAMLGVDGDGCYRLSELRTQLTRHQGQVLVSLMAVNNETGATQPLKEIAELVNQAGHLMHVDATQAILLNSYDIKKSEFAISISGHKIYGPKGIGALVCGSKLRRLLRPTLLGGGHERGLRSGTLNVPAIVGFGKAASLVAQRRQERRGKLESLRKQFLAALRSSFRGEIVVNSEPSASPHIASVTLCGANNRALLRGLSNIICFSLGSACATSKNQPSHVLSALGLTPTAANETIRCSFSHLQRIDEIESAARMIAERANALLEFVQV